MRKQTRVGDASVLAPLKKKTSMDRKVLHFHLAHMHTHMAYLFICTLTHTYTYVSILIYGCVYIYGCLCLCVYICTHTYKQKSPYELQKVQLSPLTFSTALVQAVKVY